MDGLHDSRDSRKLDANEWFARGNEPLIAPYATLAALVTALMSLDSESWTRFFMSDYRQYTSGPHIKVCGVLAQCNPRLSDSCSRLDYSSRRTARSPCIYSMIIRPWIRSATAQAQNLEEKVWQIREDRKEREWMNDHQEEQSTDIIGVGECLLRRMGTAFGFLGWTWCSYLPVKWRVVAPRKFCIVSRDQVSLPGSMSLSIEFWAADATYIKTDNTNMIVSIDQGSASR